MCDDGFSDVGASAICNEMGYDSSVITWANSNLFDSLQQSYEIAMDDVECQTDNFAECTYITSNNCGHNEDLYLTCGTGIGKWRCAAAFHVHSSNGYCLFCYVDTCYWLTFSKTTVYLYK